MKIHKIFFGECILFSTTKFRDSRGYFIELFNEKYLRKKLKINFKCKQVNYIYSKKNSLRGLHMQRYPYAQKKIVKVLEGKILDIILDVRKNSPSFGKIKKINLSNKNSKQLYIPKGFAHGYLTLSKIAKVQYLCSSFYKKKSEVTINVLDKNLKLNLNKKNFIMSKKDLSAIDLIDL